MKLTVFDVTKYGKSLEQLKKQNAPDYVVEAYKQGYTKVVNEYYKLLKVKTTKPDILEESMNLFLSHCQTSPIKVLREAAHKNDTNFMKAFFRMSNMDIMTGKRLPPEAGSMLKPGIAKDLGLKDLFKTMR